MEKVIEILNRMQAEGVIEKFAIGGGIAAIRYLEAFLTDDIDVFLSPVTMGEGGPVSFGRIYSYLAELGYRSLDGNGGNFDRVFLFQFLWGKEEAYRIVPSEFEDGAEAISD